MTTDWLPAIIELKDCFERFKNHCSGLPEVIGMDRIDLLHNVADTPDSLIDSHFILDECEEDIFITVFTKPETG